MAVGPALDNAHAVAESAIRRASERRDEARSRKFEWRTRTKATDRCRSSGHTRRLHPVSGASRASGRWRRARCPSRPRRCVARCGKRSDEDDERARAEAVLESAKKTAEAMLKTLGEMKGLPLKLGQMASYIDGLAPPGYEEKFQRS